MHRGPVASLVALGVVLGTLTVGLPCFCAEPCTVPSASHATVQSAVDDVVCNPVMLGDRTYVESVTIGRSVTVQGLSSAATVIQGQVRVTAGSVILNALTVTTDTVELRGRFHQALIAETGAAVGGGGLMVVHRAQLFGDGFESGNTSGWSSATP